MPHSLTFPLYINYTQFFFYYVLHTIFFFFFLRNYTQIVNARKLNYFDHEGITSFFILIIMSSFSQFIKGNANEYP